MTFKTFSLPLSPDDSDSKSDAAPSFAGLPPPLPPRALPEAAPPFRVPCPLVLPIAATDYWARDGLVPLVTILAVRVQPHEFSLLVHTVLYISYACSTPSPLYQGHDSGYMNLNAWQETFSGCEEVCWNCKERQTEEDLLDRICNEVTGKTRILCNLLRWLGRYLTLIGACICVQLRSGPLQCRTA